MKNSIRTLKKQIWSLRLRLFHWSLAFSILIAFLSDDDLYLDFHQIAGYFIAILMLWRIYFGINGSEYEKFRNSYKGVKRLFNNPISALKEETIENPEHLPIASFVLIVMQSLIIVALVSGVLLLGSNEFEGLFVSILMDIDTSTATLIKKVHHISTNLVMVLIFVHILGVLIDHFIHKSKIIYSMITGYKEQK